MRHSAVLVLPLLFCVLVSAADKPTLEQMRAAADAAQGEQCTKICLDVAQKLVEESNNQFTAGDVTQGHAQMDDAVKYARKATEASIATHKRQKNVEIALRKMSKRISDIKETLNVDDRPGIQKNVEDVEQLRSELLVSMFGNIDKKEKR